MNRFKILSYCFLGLVLTLTISCSNEEQENNPNSTITAQGLKKNLIPIKPLKFTIHFLGLA